MKGKLLLSLLLVSGLTLGSFNSTYAEDFNTILKTNVDNVKKGDIVPVTLELDLTNSMDEVHVYKGTLEYDKNIFNKNVIEHINIFYHTLLPFSIFLWGQSEEQG